MSVPLIIIHSSCWDGFTSAWVAKRYYNTQLPSVEPEFYFANYGTPPPDVTGRDVLMFDFSYKYEILREMKQKAKSMFVFDHHKSAQEDLKGFDFCFFDMEHSGAQLAQLYFFGDEQNDLVDYVADRDLWRFALPFSKEINAAISSYPKEFEVWDKLNTELKGNRLGFSNLCHEGEAILRYQSQCINEIAATANEVILPECFGKFAGTRILVANAPYVFASILGNKLAEQSPGKIGCAWFKRKDGKYQYSFRGIGNVDVAQICQTQGGGGHRLAAGCESDVLLF